MTSAPMHGNPASADSGTGDRRKTQSSRRRLVTRLAALVVTGLALYVVLPSLSAVFGAWPKLATLSGVWIALALLFECGSFVCNFAIQRIVLRTHGWFAVVTAGLAGNTVTNTLPGGAAAGAAVQYRMLATAGVNSDCRRRRARSFFAPRGGRSAHAPDPHAPHRLGRFRAQPHVGQRRLHRRRRLRGVHGPRCRASRNGPAAPSVGESRSMDLEQGAPSASSADGTRDSVAAATQRDTGGTGKGMEADLPARRGTSRPRLSLPSGGLPRDRQPAPHLARPPGILGGRDHRPSFRSRPVAWGSSKPA